MTQLVVLFMTIVLISTFAASEQDIEGEKRWEQNLSNEMKIGLATGGYSRVVLDCSADWMAFVVTMEKDFHGVIYTRGSFHNKDTPCYLDANGGIDFALKIPYNNNCGSERDEELGVFVTTVIVQHEKDLITPGDLGFTLHCTDEKVVTSSMSLMRSQISLVEADPSAKPSTMDGALSSLSPTNIVTLTPPKIDLNQRTREEL